MGDYKSPYDTAGQSISNSVSPENANTMAGWFGGNSEADARKRKADEDAKARQKASASKQTDADPGGVFSDIMKGIQSMSSGVMDTLKK